MTDTIYVDRLAYWNGFVFMCCSTFSNFKQSKVYFYLTMLKFFFQLMSSYTPSPKPVFSQSAGNHSLIPSTPAVAPPLQSTQNVRRSSRLFSNSYSVKVMKSLILNWIFCSKALCAKLWNRSIALAAKSFFDAWSLLIS